MNYNLLLLFPAAVFLIRCVCIASHLSREKWRGSKFAFIGISIGYPLIAGGVVGAVFNVWYSPYFLVIGVAALVFADRRNIYKKHGHD